jgi:hypothetical protein
MQHLIVIQSTDVDTIDDTPTLFLAQAQLQTIDAGYQDRGLQTPEWVMDKMQAVSREIDTRLKGELMRQLRASEARLAALRTRSEIRRDEQARVDALRERLAAL